MPAPVTRALRRPVLAVLAAGTAALLAGCGGPAAPPPAAPPSRLLDVAPASVTKLLVVVEENHSLDQMAAGMPYTYGLAERFGHATAYRAVTHPSLPNYLALVGGSTFGVADDHPPADHPVHGASVLGETVAAGGTAMVYADAMPRPCATTDDGRYAVKHNPWAYFVDERHLCEKYDVPVGRLAGDAARGDLPTVGLVVPDLCHDAHDCDLATADRWFAGVMRHVLSGPDWRAGRLAVVLTADEDDHSQDNTVLTVVIHPSQKGNVVTEPLDHYALTRLAAEVAGVDPPRAAARAASMADAFGLPLG